MVLQRHNGPPGSILGPSSLKSRLRALKPGAFERELNFKKSYVIFGNPFSIFGNQILVFLACLTFKPG